MSSKALSRASRELGLKMQASGDSAKRRCASLGLSVSDTNATLPSGSNDRSSRTLSATSSRFSFCRSNPTIAKVCCALGQRIDDSSAGLAALATTLYRVPRNNEAIPALRTTFGATITVDVLINERHLQRILKPILSAFQHAKG